MNVSMLGVMLCYSWQNVSIEGNGAKCSKTLAFLTAGVTDSTVISVKISRANVFKTKLWSTIKCIPCLNYFV